MHADILYLFLSGSVAIFLFDQVTDILNAMAYLKKSVTSTEPSQRVDNFTYFVLTTIFILLPSLILQVCLLILKSFPKCYVFTYLVDRDHAATYILGCFISPDF